MSQLLFPVMAPVEYPFALVVCAHNLFTVYT